MLHVALQDLHAGKRAQAERLPRITDAARDAELRALLIAAIGRAATQAERLPAVGGDMGGPADLWIAGILEDADRDARSHEPGPLLDTALVGAVRKAKAAEIGPGETALALARAEGQAAMEANRGEEIAADRLRPAA